MDLNGQAIVVTGAAGNLGYAIAEALASRGASLVLADRNREALEALAARVAPEALIVDGADVRTSEGCGAIVEAALRRFGAVHGLANTVGTFKMRAVADEAAEDWGMLMEVNALSALRLTTAVLPAMRAARYGRIVHTAAGAAAKGFAGGAVYAASKAAVSRIVEAAAQENRDEGVTVNCVAPGTIDTPQNRAAMPEADTSRWVKPEAIAAVFAFLLSRDSSAVNGATIDASGG
jgi:NAD(P)-dependent dehydrogenase (short-subunit alcohol dehydrogenase family)